MGKATGYYRANQGFATVYDGEPLWVAKGELVHKDHPLLKGRGTLFDPAENFGRFDLEQAAAVEKRVKRREKAPAAKQEEPVKVTTTGGLTGLITLTSTTSETG